MSAPPLVSVIVPAFNAAKYLGDALDSIYRQTYSPIEVIAVDDGSTDGTWALLEGQGDRVTRLRQPQRGAGEARNAGVAAARGELLGFLDADDLFEPQKTALQVEQLLREPTLAMVFGHVEEFVSGELSPAARARLVARPGAQPGHLAQTMLVRREAFDRVGPFGGWRVGEFLDWYLRAGDVGLTSLMLPAVVLRRRLHGANVGVLMRDARADYARVLKDSLDRRRRTGPPRQP